MVGGERHLGRADQAHGVALAAVGLLLAAGEVAGADHHLVADQDGDGHWVKPRSIIRSSGQAEDGLVHRAPSPLSR